MASIKHTDGENRKASALTDGSRPQTSAPEEEGKGSPRRERKKEDGLRSRSMRPWVPILVDVILILVLAGLLVGGFFGYRAVRDVYAPVWENRDVVFCIRLDGIDSRFVLDENESYRNFLGESVWSSNSTNADHLGTVSNMRIVQTTYEDNADKITLYITVTATARYRAGQGYYLGDTRLLAGMEGSFRLPGLSWDGVIISLCEASEVQQAATEAVPGTPTGEAPGA